MFKHSQIPLDNIYNIEASASNQQLDPRGWGPYFVCKVRGFIPRCDTDSILSLYCVHGTEIVISVTSLENVT